MLLDPRPTLTIVQTWLAHDLSDETLRTVLAVLAADPHWLLRQSPGPTTWDLALCYTPDGLWHNVHLQRQDTAAGAPVWRRTL